MRRLILFRHAKSDWTSGVSLDHDRPLAPRGVRAAPRMAQWLEAEEGIVPDLVLCSTARRTRQTLDLALGEWSGNPEVHFDEKLYLSSPERIVDIVRKHGQDAGTVMVVSHNPDLHDLTLELVDREERGATFATIGKFPTGAMAVLACAIDSWRDLSSSVATLQAFMKPRDLDG